MKIASIYANVEKSCARWQFYAELRLKMTFSKNRSLYFFEWNQKSRLKFLRRLLMKVIY